MEFEDKIAIITGGTSGIGLLAGERLLAEGARVVVNGRDAGRLERALARLDASGRRVAGVPGDIADPATGRRLVRAAVERFGGVDVLLNNAGVFVPTPFLEHREEDVLRYVGTILLGTFHATQAVAPELARRGGGAVVNTGSMWADLAIGATPSAAYSAAMAGRHALTRNLAIELARDGIRVNAVAPGVVATPIYEAFMTAGEIRDVLPTFGAMHPLGRNAEAAEVVEAILFLASPRAAFITGAVLPVDGGVTAGLPARA